MRRRWILLGVAALAVLLLIAVTLSVLGRGMLGHSAEPAIPPSVSTPAAQEELSAEDVNAWLDGQIPTALERTGIPGAVVSVVHDGQIIAARGYGYADTGGSEQEADGQVRPVEVSAEETLFRVGSISKLVTATAVMQLVEAGELDLDADIHDYLDMEIPRAYDEPVTLRHLLTHTAGFEDRLRGLLTEDPDPSDLRESVVVDPPEQVYSPGSTPAYSNYGMGLAGYVVERVSGMSFEDYVEQHIFDPLAMDSSTFRQPLPGELDLYMARGYHTVGDPPAPFETVAPAPAGAMSATGEDMARFMLAHLDVDLTGSASSDDEGLEPILSEESMEIMHAPGLDPDVLGILSRAPQMTLGFFEEHRNGQRIIGHGGDSHYFHSHMHLYPEQQAGVFISLNGNGADPLSSLTLRQDLLHGFADRYFPGDGMASGQQPDPEETRYRAEIAEGTYETTRGFHSTFLTLFGLLSSVTLTATDDGRLLIEPDQSTGAPAVYYQEVSPWVWQESDGQRVIAMETTSNQVELIVHDSAMSLVPVTATRALMLPVLGASLTVLLITVVGWPIAAILRRLRHRTVDGTTWLRTLRLLAKGGALATVVAVLGWAGLAPTFMSLTETPELAIRGLQVLHGSTVLMSVPAVIAAAGEIRQRTGWMRVAGSALLAAALIAVSWAAWELNFLAWDISF